MTLGPLSPSEARRTPDVPTGRGCRASEGGWLRAGDLDPSCRARLEAPRLSTARSGVSCVSVLRLHAVRAWYACVCVQRLAGLLRAPGRPGPLFMGWAAGDLELCFVPRQCPHF